MAEVQTIPPNLDATVFMDRVTELTGTDWAVIFLLDDRRPERLRFHSLSHTLLSHITHSRKARAQWFGTMVGADGGGSLLTPHLALLHELPGIGDTDQTQGDLPLYCMI